MEHKSPFEPAHEIFWHFDEGSVKPVQMCRLTKVFAALTSMAPRSRFIQNTISWYCKEGLSKTIQICRLVKAFPAYINAPRSQFEPAHETWYMCCDESSGETVQMCRLVRAFAAHINCAKIGIWARTRDLVDMLSLALSPRSTNWEDNRAPV